MPNKDLTTNASKRRGGNNKTGKGGFGDRPETINRAGQRNKAAVRTATEYRDYLIEILAKEISEPLPEKPTYLQKIAYEHVMRAAKGDDAEREKLLDRIWGKSTQPVSGPDGDAIRILVEYADAQNNASQAT